MDKTIHYFDHAATTPVRPEVLSAMMPYFSENFGNPANLDQLGRHAKQAVDQAKFKISQVLHCQAEEMIFTASATEADNLAIIGAARANKSWGNKIIISNLEHKGLAAAGEVLTQEGFEVIEVKANSEGLITPEALRPLIDGQTILVSVTSADNETGTIQPIKELVEVVRRAQLDSRAELGGHRILFHTDASQAAGYLDLDVTKLDIDLMTISAQKVYGPKGSGLLFIKKGTLVNPIIFGGGQQKIRSGTENVPMVVGLAEALYLAEQHRENEIKRVKALRDRLEKGIFAKIPKVILNGHPTKRLPNFLNISILDIEGEAILLYLDELGIIVNTGSACNSQSLEPSAIITALGRPYEFVHGSIRFTLGKLTQENDVDLVLQQLPEVVKKLRAISPLNLDPQTQEEITLKKAFLSGKQPHFLKKGKI